MKIKISFAGLEGWEKWRQRLVSEQVALETTRRRPPAPRPVELPAIKTPVPQVICKCGALATVGGRCGRAKCPARRQQIPAIKVPR